MGKKDKKAKGGWVGLKPEHAKQNKKLQTEELQAHVNTTVSGSGTKKKQLLINKHLYTARSVCLKYQSIQKRKEEQD